MIAQQNVSILGSGGFNGSKSTDEHLAEPFGTTTGTILG